MPKTSTRPPNAEEQATLHEATAWVNRILEEEFETEVRLQGTREDIPTLHTMLSEGPYTSDVSAELTTFGLAFGHVLARELVMQWVIHRDDQGTNFALQRQGLERFVFPSDMLVKRLEAGEEIGEINLEAMLEDLGEALAEEAVKAPKRKE